MPKPSLKKSLIAGILFITIGILLLLNNLNLLPVSLPTALFSWKTVLIIMGLIGLIKKHWFPGLVFISIGSYFLLPEILGVPRPDLSTLWPVILILVGLMILMHTFFPANSDNESRFSRRRKEHWKNLLKQTSSDYMENVVVFGGDYKKISSYDFHGGKIATVFGGMEIDLSNCCLSKEHNEIRLIAVMGGVTITVPKEWNVHTKILPIMGGVYDEIQNMPDAYVDPAAEIFIKGVVVMGGVEIKRV